LANTNSFIFVERTCTEVDPHSQQRISRPLQDYRALNAYVLLGDPGAGKTTAFEQEALAAGVKPITARDFVALEPSANYQGEILFIDGLDEMRSGDGDGRTPLDQIRQRLDKMGRPRFRLSCREADWLGASDAEALKRISPDGKITALHLNPLTAQDVTDILHANANITDNDAFLRQADEHGLGELLRNPQTLNLLMQSVGGGQWPQSRSAVYEMACRELIRETNLEHRQAQRGKRTSDDTLLGAAGYLCAIQLLSGLAGYAMDDDAASTQHAKLQELFNPADLPLMDTLKSNLFRSDGAERRSVIHRSVAEYLGARYLAQSIENHSLPVGRVIALMAGNDGGIVADLRGLAAWLSVHSPTARAALIDRDPLGVVLYGDVKRFPSDDKIRILDGLGREAQRYPWFRSGDWTSHPFGALATSDMAQTFQQILASPARADADQALLECVLDAIRHGELIPAMIEPLGRVVRDASYFPKVRSTTLTALRHITANNHAYLLSFAHDIRAGAIEDTDDELIGMLLKLYYPEIISPEEILDYFHRQNHQNLIGDYFMFWVHYLPTATPKDSLPILLDQFVKRRTAIEEALAEHQPNQMLGQVLVQGLMEHGDIITNERLCDWLGIGLDQYFEPQIEQEQIKLISQWFDARPERYKAILARSVALCAGQNEAWKCLYYCATRLYGARAPADMTHWYLTKAVEATEEQTALAKFYFKEAVSQLQQQGGQNYLTSQSLDFLDSWIKAHPIFQQWLEPLITCDLNDEHRDFHRQQAVRTRESRIEQSKKKQEWLAHFSQHHAAIRDGSAPTGVLHQLALVYQGRLQGAGGKTPDERFTHFLDGDTKILAAVHEGFRHVLARQDLPSVAEIIDLAAKGRMHFIRSPCLIGMDELYQAEPACAMQLDGAVLGRLAAFRLTDTANNDPSWFAALIQQRPALVAEVLSPYIIAMLRANNEHISAINSIAYKDLYANLAPIVLPDLLEGFPLRARKNQVGYALDPLMKGALHYLDPKTLAQLIAQRLTLKSMDVAQKVYWLACGLVIAPDIYEKPLLHYIKKNEIRINYLAEFFASGQARQIPNPANIPASTMALLVELLAPDYSPERPIGVHAVSRYTETADLMRSFIHTLGGETGEIATQTLERLLTLPKLASWHDTLRGALHTQRIARRKASFSPVNSVEVSRMLANLQPASAADLAALAFDHLQDIARNIRDGNTNDYRQYWSHDEKNKALNKPKPENDCRDTLLSDLQIRLTRLGIDAQREGSYADDKRADIRVSYYGAHQFNVPIEIKKDSHTDLWSAIGNQLIPRYVRDPGTDGHGIYLVFWFGGKKMPLPPDGKKRPVSAKALEDQLRSLLMPEERHRIQICVIDCALPGITPPSQPQ
jgi:hypothetical protein